VPQRRPRRRPLLARIITFAGLSLLLHALFLGGLAPLWPWLSEPPPVGKAHPVTLIIEVPEVEELEEPEEQLEYDGQIVETPEPEQEERPLDSEYLAEHDNTVEEETRVEEFRINPEVLADMYSTEDQIQFEDLMDLNIMEPSTGAQVGNDRFDPDRDGSLASLPSPFTLSNKDGLQKPVPAATTSAQLAGAPQNDLLDEKLGRSVNLNTREFLGATYWNLIKRLVNFYWNQNLDNLPRSVPYSKPSYTTRVAFTLTGDGALESIQVVDESGLPPLDNALIEAFRMAGPFPNPPEQLIAKDGRVYGPNSAYTVSIGQARVPYVGVDPRQGVQFPGILKAPR